MPEMLRLIAGEMRGCRRERLPAGLLVDARDSAPQSSNTFNTPNHGRSSLLKKKGGDNVQGRVGDRRSSLLAHAVCQLTRDDNDVVPGRLYKTSSGLEETRVKKMSSDPVQNPKTLYKIRTRVRYPKDLMNHLPLSSVQIGHLRRALTSASRVSVSALGRAVSPGPGLGPIGWPDSGPARPDSRPTSPAPLLLRLPLCSPSPSSSPLQLSLSAPALPLPSRLPLPLHSPSPFLSSSPLPSLLPSPSSSVSLPLILCRRVGCRWGPNAVVGGQREGGGLEGERESRRGKGSQEGESRRGKGGQEGGPGRPGPIPTPIGS